MKYKDLYFLLFVTAKNCVDATFMKDGNQSEDNKNIIKYKVIKKDDIVELRIFNNGIFFEDSTNAFINCNTDKVAYSSEHTASDKPEGAGLDLFFLKKVLDKYENITYKIESIKDVGTEYIYTFPKI